jgi:CheY-like chemotaxis protein
MDHGSETSLDKEERVGERPRTKLDRPPNVLVVDDEEDFLELTELFLGNDGFHVMKAKSASEALWLALRNPPDLVFLDLRLPGADGFQVLRALRAEPETRDIPVFACTAADIPDGDALVRAGFDAAFPKPINWPRRASCSAGSSAAEGARGTTLLRRTPG